MAESADSDHHDRRPGRESPQLALDRAVRRQRSIGQRRGVRRIEITDRNEQPRRRDDEVVSEAAVEAEPAPSPGEPGSAKTEVLGPSRALPTAPAAPRPVDQNGVVDLEPGDAVAERSDGACVLVPEGEGKRPRHRPLGKLHDVDVGVAETRAEDLHQHLARRGLWHLDLAKLGLCLPADELNCSHSTRTASRIVANFCCA